MIVHRIVPSCLLIFILALLAPEHAFSHGGVVEEDDVCVIKVNFLSAHFKVYQPRVSGHDQFCEDLPAAAESVFVMEYQHDLLGEMLVDFRIIRDVTGKGRFAKIEHVDAIDDLEAVTVFYRAAVVEPDVYTVNYEFVDEGAFIGIVSATNQDTGKVYAAVFPFEVGFTGPGYWPFIVGLLILIQLQYLIMSGRLRRWIGKGSSAAPLMVMLMGFTASDASAADYTVTWSATDGEPQINRMHSWILHVEDATGAAVTGATIEVVGGMPEHDHGLPTRPRVTEDLGNGDYRLEGLRFHMRGYWEIEVTVRAAEGTAVVTIALQL